MPKSQKSQNAFKETLVNLVWWIEIYFFHIATPQPQPQLHPIQPLAGDWLVYLHRRAPFGAPRANAPCGRSIPFAEGSARPHTPVSLANAAFGR